MREEDHFKNINVTPSGFQVRFMKEGFGDQICASSIFEALELRNDFCLTRGYRPKHLYMKFFTLDCLKPHVRVHKSGNSSLRWRVYSRLLETSEYKAKLFTDHAMAVEFAWKWSVSHNAISSVYNAFREKKFLLWLELEAKEGKPYIDTSFDLQLWKKAAHQIFGFRVPNFFPEDENSPIWIPENLHKFTAQEMGHGKQKASAK